MGAYSVQCVHDVLQTPHARALVFLTLQGQSILTTYEDLAALISESTRAVAANLAEQSSNIVDILRQEIEVRMHMACSVTNPQ